MSFIGYDAWKTSEPDNEPYGHCDVCQKRRPLTRLWAYGIETWACEKCRDPDAARDEMMEEEE